jgi:hypothetical protein
VRAAKKPGYGLSLLCHSGRSEESQGGGGSPFFASHNVSLLLYYASTVGKHGNETVIGKYVKEQGCGTEYVQIHKDQL